MLGVMPKDISTANGEDDYKCEDVIFSCREGPDKDGQNYKYSSQKKWIFSHSFLSLIYCPKNKKTDDPLKCLVHRNPPCGESLQTFCGV